MTPQHIDALRKYYPDKGVANILAWVTQSILGVLFLLLMALMVAIVRFGLI